mmetsp:Transcript_89636/g.193971  ORF Transcript_89636/g.193971 Transcript_89636/m.193971 type:complete len:439 (-) Transcript_89636:1065-2381(-)
MLQRRLDLDHQGPPLLNRVGIELLEALLLPRPRLPHMEGVRMRLRVDEVEDGPHAIAVLLVGVELCLLLGLLSPRPAHVEGVLAIQLVPVSVDRRRVLNASQEGVEEDCVRKWNCATLGLAEKKHVLLLLALHVVDGLQKPPEAEEVHRVRHHLLVASGGRRALRRSPGARAEALQIQPIPLEDHPLQVVEHLPAVHVEGEDAAGRQLEDRVVALHVHVVDGLLVHIRRNCDVQGGLRRRRRHGGRRGGCGLRAGWRGPCAGLTGLLGAPEQVHGGVADLARRGHGLGGAPGPDVRLEDAVGEVELDVAAGQHPVVRAWIEDLAGHSLQPQNTALSAVVGQPAPLQVARAAARHAADLELGARVRAHDDAHRAVLVAHRPHVPGVQVARVRAAGAPVLGAGQLQLPVARQALPALVEDNYAEGARLPVVAAVLEDVLL